MILQEKIKDNFSRAALDYEDYADLQSALAEGLLQRLLRKRHKYESILDIGCGTGALLGELKKHFSESSVFGIDISLAMAAQTKLKMLKSQVADAGYLPFKDEVFDLVLSNTVYQWVFNLNESFQEAARVLREKGVLMFTCFGSHTLRELRSCFEIEKNYLPTKEAIMESLKRGGFSEVDFSSNLQYKYFDNLNGILYWLKHVGANRISPNPPLLTPGRLAELSRLYSSRYRSNGKVYASFEVFWIEAKK